MKGTPGGRLGRFFCSHPVMLLLILTPGIPEYLSGSSQVAAIVLNPPFFLLQLFANLGLYGPGALLIREAKVRWHKGWATVLLLGAAYGILEEGVALSTLFNPNAGPVGSLGTYGHWLGVNWVWAAGIVPFHAVFSISIPILLLGMILPEASGRSFLGGRRMAATVAVLLIDVVLLMAFVTTATGYWMGLPILLLSLVSVGTLVWAGRRASPGLLSIGGGKKAVPGRSLAIIGIAFLPVTFLSQGVPEGVHIPAAADFLIVLLVLSLFPAYLARRTWNKPRGTVILVFGLVTPIMVLGVLSQLGLPLVLVADAALVLLFRKLLAAYPARDEPTAFSHP